MCRAWEGAEDGRGFAFRDADGRVAGVRKLAQQHQPYARIAKSVRLSAQIFVNSTFLGTYSKYVKNISVTFSSSI